MITKHMTKTKKCSCSCESKSGIKRLAKKAVAGVKKLKAKFDQVDPKTKKKVIAGAVAAAGVVAGLAAVAAVKGGLGKNKK